MYAKAIEAIGRSIKHGDCWVYPTTNDTGYGIISVGDRRPSVSRLILRCATHQPLNHPMDACHKSPLCRYKACCNPEHLYWDTHQANCIRRELERQARGSAKEMVSGMFTGASH